MQTSSWLGGSRWQLVLRLAGAALLTATGAIHLDLYLTGYRHIPTIGWLFLLQVIAAFALAAAVLAIRSPLVAAAGAGFAASTLAGYLLSIWIGLFGFTEVRTTAGIVAGVIEVAAFAVLALLALSPGPAAGQAGHRQRQGIRARPGRLQELDPAQRTMASRAVAGLTAVALIVLGITVAGAGGSTGSPSAGQTTPPPGSGAVLTIVIKNFKFSPAAPKVNPGQRVEVKNEDSVAHTLSAGPAAKFAGAFDTGNVGPGQVTFFTAPKQAGGYPFYCKIHTFMIGMLAVGHSPANAAALSSFRAAVRAHPMPYCGGRPAARTASARRERAARRAPAGPLASGD
jgi:plastocyanin